MSTNPKYIAGRLQARAELDPVKQGQRDEKSDRRGMWRETAGYFRADSFADRCAVTDEHFDTSEVSDEDIDSLDSVASDIS